MSWEAFADYERDGLSLTVKETEIVALLVAGKIDEAKAKMTEHGWVAVTPEKTTVRREGKEFAEKLPLLGLLSPWE